MCYRFLMSSLLERIKSEIRELPHEERLSLWVELTNEFDPPDNDEDEDDEQSVEEAWDEEIESRMKDVMEGRVQLISSEEMDRHIDAWFAERGMERTTPHLL